MTCFRAKHVVLLTTILVVKYLPSASALEAPDIDIVIRKVTSANYKLFATNDDDVFRRKCEEAKGNSLPTLSRLPGVKYNYKVDIILELDGPFACTWRYSPCRPKTKETIAINKVKYSSGSTKLKAANNVHYEGELPLAVIDIIPTNAGDTEGEPKFQIIDATVDKMPKEMKLFTMLISRSDSRTLKYQKARTNVPVLTFSSNDQEGKLPCRRANFMDRAALPNAFSFTRLPRVDKTLFIKSMYVIVMDMREDEQKDSTYVQCFLGEKWLMGSEQLPWVEWYGKTQGFAPGFVRDENAYMSLGEAEAEAESDPDNSDSLISTVTYETLKQGTTEQRKVVAIGLTKRMDYNSPDESGYKMVVKISPGVEIPKKKQS